MHAYAADASRCGRRAASVFCDVFAALMTPFSMRLAIYLPLSMPPPLIRRHFEKMPPPRRRVTDIAFCRHAAELILFCQSLFSHVFERF